MLTSYLTFVNRIQENVINGGLRTSTESRYDADGRFIPGRRSRTRAVTGIAQNTQLNRALWSLAEKLAEKLAEIKSNS